MYEGDLHHLPECFNVTFLAQGASINIFVLSFGDGDNIKGTICQLKHMKFIHIYTVHSCSASEMQAPKSPTYIGLVKEDLYFRFVMVSMLAM